MPGDGSRGVVGQVQEEADIPHGTILLEVRLEEPGCLHVHLDTQQGGLEGGLCSLRAGALADWLTVPGVTQHLRRQGLGLFSLGPQEKFRFL